MNGFEKWVINITPIITMLLYCAALGIALYVVLVGGLVLLEYVYEYPILFIKGLMIAVFWLLILSAIIKRKYK